MNMKVRCGRKARGRRRDGTYGAERAAPFRVSASIGILACALAASPAMAASPDPSSGPSPDSFITPEFLAAHTLLDINAQYAYAKGLTGKNVLIAVADNGQDIHHPEFAGRVSPFAANFLTVGDPSDVSHIPGSNGYGHGTHVAGIAAAARDGVGMHGVAYDAHMLPLRILGGPGHTTTEDDAFDHAIAHGAGVLNGSYGPPAFPAPTVANPVTGDPMDNPHYRVVDFQLLVINPGDKYETLKKGADADIVMVFAAGNEFGVQPIASESPSGNAMLPAITPENSSLGWYRFALGLHGPEAGLHNPDSWVLRDLDDPDVLELDFSDLQGALIAVVSVDRNGQIADYSNRCGYAHLWCIAAPGGGRFTPGYSGEEAFIWSTMPGGEYGYDLGTSMAAPVVSGAAAVLRQAFPYMTARQIIEVLLTSANNRDKDWNDRSIYGWGMLDLGRAVGGPVQFGAEGFPGTFSVDTRGYDTVWSNDIAGTGGLVKNGQGKLVMTGANTYTGATRVSGGKLSVDGSLRHSELTVEKQGFLGGTGTLGKVVAAGTVQPGNSIGTLTVAGDYTQLAGSALEIELGEGGASDRLQVEGVADIQGGELRVLGLTAGALNHDFRFMSAASLAGGFDNAGDLGLAYIDMALSQVNEPLTPSIVQPGLQLSVRRNAVAFADLASNGNQAAVARAIEQQGRGAGEYDQAVLLPDARGAADMYDAFSGELHASARSALIDTSGLLRHAALGRLGQADVGFVNGQAAPASAPHGAWARVLGSWGALGASGDASRMTRSVGGVMFGADTRVGQAGRAGLAAAYTGSSYGAVGAGSAQADGYHLMAYGSASYGPWNLRGGASYSWYELATRRRIDYRNLGSFRADYRAGAAQVFAEVSYAQPLGGVTLEPYAALAQVWSRTGGFSESGGVGALQASSERHSMAFSTLGLRGRLDLSRPEGRQLAAMAGLGWRHAMGGNAPVSELRFASGPGFGVAGAPLARNALVAEAGIEWAATPGGRLSLVYTGQIAGSTQDHGIQARASWRF